MPVLSPQPSTSALPVSIPAVPATPAPPAVPAVPATTRTRPTSHRKRKIVEIDLTLDSDEDDVPAVPAVPAPPAAGLSDLSRAQLAFSKIPFRPNFFPPPFPSTPGLVDVYPPHFEKWHVCPYPTRAGQLLDLYSLGQASRLVQPKLFTDLLRKPSLRDLCLLYPILYTIFAFAYSNFPRLGIWQTIDFSMGPFVYYSSFFSCPCPICPFCLASLTCMNPPFRIRLDRDYSHPHSCKPCSWCQLHMWFYPGYRRWVELVSEYILKHLCIMFTVSFDIYLEDINCLRIP